MHRNKNTTMLEQKSFSHKNSVVCEFQAIYETNNGKENNKVKHNNYQLMGQFLDVQWNYGSIVYHSLAIQVSVDHHLLRLS